MRALIVACMVLAAVGTAGAAGDPEPVEDTLDLLNWGLGVFYLHGAGLGQESNGWEGWQEEEAVTPQGVVAPDLLVLP